jgi:hypothetical protein
MKQWSPFQPQTLFSMNVAELQLIQELRVDAIAKLLVTGRQWFAVLAKDSHAQPTGRCQPPTKQRVHWYVTNWLAYSWTAMAQQPFVVNAFSIFIICYNYKKQNNQFYTTPNRLTREEKKKRSRKKNPVTVTNTRKYRRYSRLGRCPKLPPCRDLHERRRRETVNVRSKANRRERTRYSWIDLRLTLQTHHHIRCVDRMAQHCDEERHTCIRLFQQQSTVGDYTGFENFRNISFLRTHF